MTFIRGISFFGVFFIVSWILPLYSSWCYLVSITNNAWDYTSLTIAKFLRLNIYQVNDESLIKKGCILTNHRCFTDFFLDPYLFQCPSIARRAVILLISPWFAYIAILCNRAIFIDRTSGRDTVYANIKSCKKDLIHFYPEGTRCVHMTLPENKDDIPMRVGLLKSIYEDTEKPEDYCVQIVISKNKEKVLNERTFLIGFDVNVLYITGKPIFCRDYATFADFIDKIKENWKELWNEVYSVDESQIVLKKQTQTQIESEN